MDLRGIIKEITKRVNFGEYGGHKFAAGCLFATEKEEEFIQAAKEVLEGKSIEENIR